MHNKQVEVWKRGNKRKRASSRAVRPLSVHRQTPLFHIVCVCYGCAVSDERCGTVASCTSTLLEALRLPAMHILQYTNTQTHTQCGQWVEKGGTRAEEQYVKKFLSKPV